MADASSTPATPYDESTSKMLKSNDEQESEPTVPDENEVESPGNEEQGEDPDTKGGFRESLIKQEGGMLNLLCKACEEGELAPLQFLLRQMAPNIDLSTAKFSEGGSTPLHVASNKGHREMVKFLLDKGASPMVEDEARNTPLHLAATHGHLEVAMDLLDHESQRNEEACESARSNLLQTTNTGGLSPFGCAIKAPEPHFRIAKEFLNVVCGNPANAIPDFSKSQLFSKFDTVPLDKPAKIFIVGDSMAGKSTLVKSLQEGKSAFSRLLIGLIASKLVTNIDEHFSGIITTDFANANFRRVLFHDLAGHTNYFNESLLEPNDSLDHTIFIVMVDLRCNPQKTEERLIYWLSFLHYHTSRLASESTKPNIVVVGSHKDMKREAWRSGEKLNEVSTEALKKRPQLYNYFNQLMKPVSLDCRRFEVSEARQLRTCLQKHCQNSIYQQLEATSPPSICYVLSQVLFDSKEFPPFLKLAELAQRITDLSTKPGLSLYKLLPTEPLELMEICKMLHKHDRLMIVENPVSSSDLYHWIVHDIHALLTEIDKRLATLKKSLSGSSENFEIISQQEIGYSFSHFGIVTREKLESVFSGSRKPSRKGSASSALKVSEPSSTSPSSTASSTSNLSLNSNLAVELLLKYKYCEAINSNDPAFSDESFFFPGLLRSHEDVDEPVPWELGTNYSFAWCVVPCWQDDKVVEFFLPRFLKKLLLCFIEKYIIHHPDKQGQHEQDDISSMSSSNETGVVWSRGVSWSTSDDTKVNIELNDNAIILSMQSQEGNELNCLQLRNKILATIEDEKKKWQPDIATNEFVIPFGDNFPVQLKTLDSHQRIPLESVEKAILKGKSKVDEVALQSLLFFEPCIAMSRLTKPLWDAIRDPNQSLELSQESISEIFDELGKEFIHHFNLPDLRSESTPQPHTSSTQSVTMDIEEEALVPTSLPDSQTTCSVKHTSPQLARPSTMVHESNEWSITHKKLLECMNSISIMDTVEFLQQLEEHQSCTPPSEASSQERDEIPLDSGGCKDSTLKRSQQQHSTFTLSDSDLPFIEAPTVLQCGSEQQVYHSKRHGIKLVFPSGAVTKGTVGVEIGILLSGPFTLPTNVKPVSPILWLCVEENRSHKFSKPISITLPHFIDCITPEDQNKFAFLKASHESVSDSSFTFKEVTADHCKFQPGSGMLKTKHCCLICIAYKEPQDMIDKSNYCLISVVPRDIVQPKFTMYYCLTFNLKTYIEVLQSQFPDCEILAKKVFKFANGSTEQQQRRAITIQFSTHLPHGWIVANSGFESKIAASDVDFYSNAFGYLRYLEEDENYPPRFALEVNGSSATKANILCVTFKGSADELKIEKTLTVFHRQLSVSQSLDRVFIEDPQDRTKQHSPSVSSFHSRNTSTQSIPVASILERHLGILIQYLNIELIRPVLRKHGVLLSDEAGKLIDLGSHPSASHRSVIETLVTILNSKGASGIYYFKKALEETTEAMGHQDILKELSKDPDFEAVINNPSYAGN